MTIGTKSMYEISLSACEINTLSMITYACVFVRARGCVYDQTGMLLKAMCNAMCYSGTITVLITLFTIAVL